MRLDPTLANRECSLAADDAGVGVGSPALGALKFESSLVEDVPMNLIPDLRLGTTAGAARRTSVVESREVVLHGYRMLGPEPSTC